MSCDVCFWSYCDFVFTFRSSVHSQQRVPSKCHFQEPHWGKLLLLISFRFLFMCVHEFGQCFSSMSIIQVNHIRFGMLTRRSYAMFMFLNKTLPHLWLCNLVPICKCFLACILFTCIRPISVLFIRSLFTGILEILLEMFQFLSLVKNHAMYHRWTTLYLPLHLMVILFSPTYLSSFVSVLQFIIYWTFSINASVNNLRENKTKILSNSCFI